jgi:putative flippase GtrA
MKAGKGLHTLLMKFMNKKFLKFLLAGGMNTLITYCFYLFLVSYTHYNLAYSIAYLLGIVSSYILNSLFVFREKMTIKKGIQFPLVYLVQYLLSLFLIYLFVELFGINPKIAPLSVVVLTTPATFLLSKYILSSKFLGNK